MENEGLAPLRSAGVPMLSRKFMVPFALFWAATGSHAESPAPVADSLTYADLADLALPAPVVAHVRLRSASRLKPAQAPDLPVGVSRFYVQADVISLIHGAQGLPVRVSYLVDVPDVGGRPAKLAKKSQYIALAATVPGRPGELQLQGAGAHLPYTPARAERVRGILQEATRADAPPRITGIGRAFHVPGSLPGESETQIFLRTADNEPVSLSVLRRPGETPRWAVALSEIVDDAAAPPQPNSLLWYRLACSLPAALPPQSYAEGEAEHAGAIQADYRLIKERLGPCARSRS
jgi:hypothetical protein